MHNFIDIVDVGIKKPRHFGHWNIVKLDRGQYLALTVGQIIVDNIDERLPDLAAFGGGIRVVALGGVSGKYFLQRGASIGDNIQR